MLETLQSLFYGSHLLISGPILCVDASSISRLVPEHASVTKQ